jgi:hypothetical protein
MSRTARVVLRLSALWALWVWVVLLWNMAHDHTHGLGFRVVHSVLAVISLGFAAATWRIAQRSRGGSNYPRHEP